MMLGHDSFFNRSGRDDFFGRGHGLAGGEVITSGKSNQQCFMESSSSITENGVTRKSTDSKFFNSDNQFPSLKHSIFDVGRDNFLDPPSWSALEWNQPSSFFRRSGLRDSSRLQEERRIVENKAAAEAEAKSRMVEKERLEEKERLDALSNQADRGYCSTTNPDQFEVEVDVQGFSPDELFVRTEGRKLIITAQAKQEEGNSENVFRREIKKEFDLPDDVNPYDVSSRLLPDGFLRVEAPIKDKAAIGQ
jgi:HSP20 family molecular chaperone IbpA